MVLILLNLPFENINTGLNLINEACFMYFVILFWLNTSMWFVTKPSSHMICHKASISQGALQSILLTGSVIKPPWHKASMPYGLSQIYHITWCHRALTSYELSQSFCVTDCHTVPVTWSVKQLSCHGVYTQLPSHIVCYKASMS